MLDILSIQPTTVSRDLKGKYILVYSLPKVGKTSFATQCPGSFLLAFEKGYNALGGILAADMTKWSDFKIVLRQLAKPEAKEKFSTIIIDTVGIAYDLCSKYICSLHGANTIGDIPYGKGYEMLDKEFSAALREITMMGYGLIFIAHASIRSEKIDDENSIVTVEPNISKRPYNIVNQLVDIIGYIGIDFKDDGTSTRTMYTQRTRNVVAGSRFRHMPPTIPFGYQEFVDALSTAIDKQGQDGETLVDTADVIVPVIQERPFEDIVNEAKELWISLNEKDKNNAVLIMDKVEEIFGTRKKLSEITENEKQAFEILVNEMKML